MFKKSTISSRILYCVLAVVASVALFWAFASFGEPQNAKATQLQNNMNLATPTDISGGTINFSTPNGEASATYNGNPMQIVKSITVGSDEIYATASDQTTNFVVTYKRNGEASTDQTSAGVLQVVVEGQNNYSGSISANFTINKAQVKAEFQIPENGFVIDDTANNSMKNGSGIPVFLTTIDGVSISNPQGLYITYFNKTLGHATNGFTNSGDYLINVAVESSNYTLTGSPSCELYVKASKLVSDDNLVCVTNEKGFEKGVVLGDASLVTSKNIINARGDISNKDSVVAMVNLNFLKNGKPYILEDEVVVTVDVSNIDTKNIVLQGNDYSNSKFEKVEFTAEEKTISFSAKASATDQEGNTKLAGTNTYIIVDATSNVSWIMIVTFALTGVAIVLLLIINFMKNCIMPRKK